MFAGVAAKVAVQEGPRDGRDGGSEYERKIIWGNYSMLPSVMNFSNFSSCP